MKEGVYNFGEVAMGPCKWPGRRCSVGVDEMALAGLVTCTHATTPLPLPPGDSSPLRLLPPQPTHHLLPAPGSARYFYGPGFGATITFSGSSFPGEFLPHSCQWYVCVCGWPHHLVRAPGSTRAISPGDYEGQGVVTR